MAVADQPSGLMDIASTLTQDEIPFKLRCATCNKLAVNAFRLPCCDQAICENCQTSLPETCPVCAHNPISPDLCKPNKALRTTLKAFLRTEEKKREKDRLSATPATPVGATPADATPVQQDPTRTTNGPESDTVQEAPEPTPTAAQEQVSLPSNPVERSTENVTNTDQEIPAEPVQLGNEPLADAPKADAAESDELKGDGTAATNGAEPTEQEGAQSSESGAQFTNAMGPQMTAGGFPNMGWNSGNAMAPFMANGMFGMQNSMGMPMAMDPMAANQGMFGGYGMNMNGMNNGMNMGMNFDASQGMYGGWDGSQNQNNMWNGGQDKFNPNAFANGMAPPYGGNPSGFGGYNMSQPNGNYAQFPNQDFHSGYYGSGYGRGNFRGRGRGYYGRGRGGFAGHMQSSFPHNANHSGFQNPNTSNASPDVPHQPQHGVSSVDASAGSEAKPDEEAPAGDQQSTAEPKEQTDEMNNNTHTEESIPNNTTPESQLRGIPTIDSLDEMSTEQGMSMGMIHGHTGPPGYGRGGYNMHGSFPGGRGGGFQGGPFMGPNMQVEPRGQGVEGAPAAPRAMRQGFPNTSVFRQRNFPSQQGQGSAHPVRSDASQSGTPVNHQDEPAPRSRSQSRSKSKARSVSRSKSRSKSPPQHQPEDRRPYRARSPSINGSVDDRDRRRERQKRPRREDRYDESAPIEEDRRTRPVSPDSSRRSSRRGEKDRDRRSGRRSHRSHRHRSRSLSASRNGDSRDADRLSAVPEDNGVSSRDHVSVSGDAVEGSSRNHRSTKDRSSRRGEERDRDREVRRRDRDRDRDRERERDRDRDRDRERNRESDRDRHRDKERDRDRDKDRKRDRKRTRRDRSETPADSDYSSRHQSRRIKRSREDDIRTGDRDTHTNKPISKVAESEKDPHTLEREARNRERLLKEQQRRSAMSHDNGSSSHKPGRKRDRGTLPGGRRINYKYEDEETESARATRVEREREAGRWA